MHYFLLLLNSEYNQIDLDKIIKASCIYVVHGHHNFFLWLAYMYK